MYQDVTGARVIWLFLPSISELKSPNVPSQYHDRNSLEKTKQVEIWSSIFYQIKNKKQLFGGINHAF